MKRSVLSILVFIALGLQANAQKISKNAIGIRLSESNGFGPEVNYQRAVGTSNRLELGLGWHTERWYDDVKFTGIYQWVWNIDGGFNWYAGPGIGAGMETYDRWVDDDYRSSRGYGFATGDVGLEYSFDFPLLISFDLRPQANFNYRDDINFDVGISARYQF